MKQTKLKKFSPPLKNPCSVVPHDTGLSINPCTVSETHGVNFASSKYCLYNPRWWEKQLVNFKYVHFYSTSTYGNIQLYLSANLMLVFRHLIACQLQELAELYNTFDPHKQMLLIKCFSEYQCHCTHSIQWSTLFHKSHPPEFNSHFNNYIFSLSHVDLMWKCSYNWLTYSCLCIFS